MSLSMPQIAAQLDAVLAREPTAHAVAIRSKTRQAWPDSFALRNRRFTLKWCESMLAVREALSEEDEHGTPDAGLLLLTPLSTHELALDITARLARGRVFQPEGWEIVRQLFGAKDVDARLSRFSWLPQLLVDGAAQGPYQPVPNGFLDLETAWLALLRRFLQLDVARPDAAALLLWTLKPGADASLNLLPATARPDLLRWLGDSAGLAGTMVLACIEAGRTGDAMALGLVCGVLFSPEGEGQAALGHAAIRLERFVNDAHVGLTEGRAWADAARQLIRDGKAETYRGVLDRADTLLAELRVAEFATLSDVLPLGLDQRMAAFSACITQHIQEPSEDHLANVEAAGDRVLSHVLLGNQLQRADRVEMARRLARWLLRPEVQGSAPSDLLLWQADEGAFVDWARFRLLGGDELAVVSQAYAALREAVILRRSGVGRRFALSLQQWNAQASNLDGRLVPLESVLDRVVAPLAALQPVLLLVVDGLSVSIFRELFARPEALGWTEMVPAALGRPLAGIAAFPTVTEVSRATLLCGRLTTGTSALEKSGFATHAALLTHSRADAPPKLFHKGDLSDMTNLAEDVRAAIANPQQRIVGVVYNAVDDHLSGPDQLHQRWSLEDLRLLLPLVREAREARRAIIVTADHGHLLEDGSTQVQSSESDRWRPGNDVRHDSEVALQGGRVRTASGDSSVVCLWSEKARYAGRKNGYHGGVSPQEVTVPLSVLLPFGVALTGWQPALPAQPEWWDLPSYIAPPAVFTVSAPPHRNPPRRGPPTPTPAQSALFEPTESPALPATATTQWDWLEGLFQSTVYASQRQLAARVAPTDEQMRKLLTALIERGGKLSRAALAQRLALPEIRLGGMLSAARRVLNVDQSTVLTIDETTGTIELNEHLLRQQFVIPVSGAAR